MWLMEKSGEDWAALGIAADLQMQNGVTNFVSDYIQRPLRWHSKATCAGKSDRSRKDGRSSDALVALTFLMICAIFPCA